MPENFGNLTTIEKQTISYDKDSTANAIVLYEKGYNYFSIVDRRTVLKKNYHVKIKILNEQAYHLGTVKIPFFASEEAYEKIAYLKAITHNGNKSIEVSPSAIFTNEISENWRERTFIFPNLEPGSILEYAYTIETPFHYNFSEWEFQKEIPVIHSEFVAMIPGNWKYNQAIYGNLSLATNETSLKKDCFLSADCEVYKYIMTDIPSFKEDENYMLASSNYISRIEFELVEYKSVVDGYRNRYTRSWKDVDREFKKDKDIGKQLSKIGFFEKQIPENLLVKGDELKRAKEIFNFIKEHFTWNEKYGIYQKARVKEAFDKKSGSVSEINMSLINLLNAAGLKTNLMLLSTRKNGLPKKIYPVMSDFNYCIAKVEVDGEDYLLDATDKYMAFGMLPFRALNHYGRVMDFKNESYWYDIRPTQKNRHQIRAQLKFDVEEKKGFGIFDVVNLGYNAVHTRENLDQYDEEKYLDTFEENITGDFSITSYELRKDFNSDTKVSERFEFDMENILNSDMVYLNPFLIRFFEKNPFLLDERHFPVDFGYPREYKFNINIDIPEGYKVHELPENKAIQLGEKMVVFKFFSKEGTNQIAFNFNLTINSTHIQPENYQGLKDIFKHVTDVQNNSLIVLKKL